MISVRNLAKSFGGVQAVHDCSLEIQTGTITGLIGPNGAGKTTLFNMIAGALRPSSGQILFDGADITGRQPHELFRLGIVRTFQIPHEFAQMTVLENLMLVPPQQAGEHLFTAWFGWRRVRREEQAIRARAEEVLDFLHLDHLHDERAGNLSGGQKKLLELGRTMMTEARLVLLDEPGAGVNPTLMVELAEMVRRLNEERGYTFCIIEHDMDLIAQLCDPVYVLAEGTVLTHGPMAEIRRDPRVLEAYLGGSVADSLPQDSGLAAAGAGPGRN